MFVETKRRQPSGAYFPTLVTAKLPCNVNKQEQFTPQGREPSELLALRCEYWRYSSWRESRAESSISLLNGSAPIGTAPP